MMISRALKSLTEHRQELANDLAKVDAAIALLGGKRRGRPAKAALAAPTKRRRRRGMSAAQKKAVSIRMKAYWASRRKKARD